MRASRMAPSRACHGTCLLLVVALLGCQADLEPYYLVKDLRVLGIKATPPEILYDMAAPGIGTPPPPEPVRFEALVVEPQGGEVAYSWSFCPVETGHGCSNYEKLRDDAPAELQDDLDQLRSVRLDGTAQMQQVDGAEGIWPHEVAAFDLTLPPALATYFAQDNIFGAGLGAWPSALLELRAADGRNLLAYKRVVLGLRDLRGLAANLAVHFGYTVCEEGMTPEDTPGCILIADRDPNSNPEIEKIQVAYAKEPDPTFSDIPGTLTMHADNPLRILPVVSEASYESYQTIGADLQTMQLSVEDRQEEISISWFCTAGEFQERITWPVLTKSLDTVYYAPAEPPTETSGMVTIWVVARDQRGGIDWAHLQVRVLSN